MVIARSAEPLLRPEAAYERAGPLANVVFTCGHVSLDDTGDRIRVYYGAADSVIAAADLDVREVVDSLRGVDPCSGHEARLRALATRSVNERTAFRTDDLRTAAVDRA